MAYLFQCAIGPVQDFIASARRSRDLWYGSWLLSELSKATAKALVDEFGLNCLIFPSPEVANALAPESEFNVPNKIVAVISGTPQGAGTLVKQAIDKRLTNLRKEAFEHIHGSFAQGLAEQQIADLVEIYWVAVPIDGKQYTEARELGESLLASRKSTRNFRQTSGSTVPKSSLDGVRESVIPKSAYPEQGDPPETVQNKQRMLYLRYGARRGEQLSGVDLLKRLGQRNNSIEQRFNSTSHMAALPFLERAKQRKGEGADARLLQAIRAILDEEEIDAEDKDGSLIYTSRLREWIPDNLVGDVVKQVNALLREYGGDSEPNPYYALLLADGDNMGKAIDNQQNQEDHRKLSQALSSFAQSVAQVVKSYQGVPIYAGGDDVLAYLPMHTVLGCAKDLADTFAEQLETFKTVEGKSPTLSVGIVVVHHLMPLSDALLLARQAEKAAKDVPGKDALAVTISKRSGVDRTIAGRREVLVTRLTAMIDMIRHGSIGKGVAYEFQDLHRVLDTEGGPREAIAAEAQRIVTRKRESGGDRTVDKEVLEEFATWIVREGVSVKLLAQELIVAGNFATLLNQVEGTLVGTEEVAL